jgi:hypothetical protein
MATQLTEINLGKYKPYLCTKNGKPVVYMKLKKCLYGTLHASLRFWKDLSGVLQEWGFALNEYDKCVANKLIRGNQCTILWHVDDLKISHAEPEVVTMIISQLSERFGKMSERNTMIWGWFRITLSRTRSPSTCHSILDKSLPTLDRTQPPH